MAQEIPKKPSIDEIIGAILDRQAGTPFSAVMDTYGMTANQFYKAVMDGKLNECVRSSRGIVRSVLSSIAKDPEKKKELFRMDEDFLMDQYEQVYPQSRKNGQYRFPYGTLSHPHNIDSLVYIALSRNNPLLGSEDREEVVKGFAALPKDLARYIRSIRLGGVFANVFHSSTHLALDSFDYMYQEKTGDNSLFDLEFHPHLHRWGFLESDFKGRQAIWKDDDNVVWAVYHTLTEAFPKLSSYDREEVISALKGMPRRMQDRLYSLGLGGLMNTYFLKGEKGSAIAALKKFDIAYQRKTGDHSLFDLSVRPHLHIWSILNRAPIHYWDDKKNVEEAVFHMLSEDRPNLASQDYQTAKIAFASLPDRMIEYLHGMGFRGLMAELSKESPGYTMHILKVFDKAYQRKTGNKSLLH